MKFIFLSIFILAGLLLLPGAQAFIEKQQQGSEQFYTNLGTATLRIMDPELRKGIEMEGAWVLKNP